MKTIFALSFLFFIFCLSCHTAPDSPRENGWYHLCNGDTDSLSREPIVTVKEFAAIRLDSSGNPPHYMITGSISKHRVKRWTEATEKAIGKQIAFVYNNEIITAPQVNMRIESGNFSISNPYGHHLKKLFHQLRREKTDSIRQLLGYEEKDSLMAEMDYWDIYAWKHKGTALPDSYGHGQTDTLTYKRLENALAEELKKLRTSSHTDDYMQSTAYKNYKAYLADHPECIRLMFQSFLFKGSPQGLYGYLIDDIIQGKYPEAPSIRDLDNQENKSAVIREYQKKITELINTGQATKNISGQDKAVLQNQIDTLIRAFNAKVGVAIRYDGEETVAVNDSSGYAMLSTFKFPLALAVLHELDQKQLPTETEIYVAKSDLHPNTYSPLRDARPEGNFKISIGELLKYTVTLSDNNACDILIHYLGGPAAIQNYLARTGITGITIVATEDEMHQKEDPYLNHARPSAVVELLEKFLGRTLLSSPYQEFLEKIMLETSTGADKLKGLLPSGTPVGHKTGSSDRNANGLKAADNDVGFVMLPNGKHFTIAVFVMDSTEDDKANALLIARIAKAAYEHYSPMPPN